MSGIFRDDILNGRVAFVTGGGSGIGQRMAERFAAHGAKVVLAGRKRGEAGRAAPRSDCAGGTVQPLRSMSAITPRSRRPCSERTTMSARSTFCCAARPGISRSPVAGMSANGFKAVIDIDLLGTFNTCRAAYRPYLRKPGRVGDQHFGQSGDHVAIANAGPRVRGQGRRRNAHEDAGARMGTGRDPRELHHARADRRYGGHAPPGAESRLAAPCGARSSAAEVRHKGRTCGPCALSLFRRGELHHRRHLRLRRRAIAIEDGSGIGVRCRFVGQPILGAAGFQPASVARAAPGEPPEGGGGQKCPPHKTASVCRKRLVPIKSEV